MIKYFDSKKPLWQEKSKKKVTFLITFAVYIAWGCDEIKLRFINWIQKWFYSIYKPYKNSPYLLFYTLKIYVLSQFWVCYIHYYIEKMQKKYDFW